MNKTEEKIIIGFIVYGNSTAKYLPYFLPSLKAQTNKNFEIIVFDNSDEDSNENEKYLKTNNSEIKIFRKGKNVGFAKAYNRMIDEAMKNGAKYFLALNPDMVLDENFLDEILKTVKITLHSSSNITREIYFTQGSTVGFEIDNSIHYYEYVNSRLTWTDAKIAAENKTFNGMQGYLATITSKEENDFIVQKISSNTWMGASDIENQSIWKWATGPEAGTHFFTN